MRSSRILLAVGLASFLQSVIWADQVQLVGDAYFNPGGSGFSGALSTINIGGPANSQGLLQFSFAALPAGTTAAQVSNASLRLFVNAIGQAGAVDIYAANGAWNEATVTGTGYPTPGNPQGSAYASLPAPRGGLVAEQQRKRVADGAIQRVAKERFREAAIAEPNPFNNRFGIAPTNARWNPAIEIGDFHGSRLASHSRRAALMAASTSLGPNE